MSCELWNCRWLVDDDTHDQPRPDRSGIVLDIMPDIIGLTPEGESERHEVQVIVAWVDPARRDAHRSPAFRKYVERQTVPVLVRYSSSEGFVIFPPSMTGGQGIVEHESSKSGHDGRAGASHRATARSASRRRRVGALDCAFDPRREGGWAMIPSSKIEAVDVLVRVGRSERQPKSAEFRRQAFAPWPYSRAEQ